MKNIKKCKNEFLFKFKYIYFLNSYLLIKYKIIIKIKNMIGDWGLGIGDWGLGPIPNHQSPIPNPQSPIL